MEVQIKEFSLISPMIESTDVFQATETAIPPASDRFGLSRRFTFIALLVSLILIACTQDFRTVSSVNNSPAESTVLQLWWDKGFTLEEDEALQQVVSNWKKKKRQQNQAVFL